MKKIKTSLSLLSLNNKIEKNPYLVIEKTFSKDSTPKKSKTFGKNLSKKVVISKHFDSDLLKYPLNISFLDNPEEASVLSTKKSSSVIFLKLDNMVLKDADKSLLKNLTTGFNSFLLLKSSLNKVVISKFFNKDIL
jgi:hypothetical protein